MRRFNRGFVASLVLIVSTSALAQEFEAYEGKNTVQEGEGGTKKVVNGIEFWSNGSPPHKFKLLGYIHDRRQKTGLVGMVRMSSLEPNIAKAAKAAGGDAVILISSQAETVGVVGHGNSATDASATAYGNNAYGRSNTNTTMMAAAVQKQESRFAVVKYLPDADSVAAPAAKDETSKP